MAILDLALGNNVFIQNSLDAYIQEIDILFSTTQTEMIGDPLYGCNFELYLHLLKPDMDELKIYVLEKLETCYYYHSFKTDIEVELLTGEYREIYVIHLTIYTTLNKVAATRTYQYK